VVQRIISRLFKARRFIVNFGDLAYGTVNSIAEFFDVLLAIMIKGDDANIF
jgi:hypothetical protein